MNVKRIREAPRITRPFSDDSWARLDRLGEQVDADLKAGKTFADTAKIYSEDTSSRNQGGDIGVIVATDTRVPARGARSALSKFLVY